VTTTSFDGPLRPHDAFARTPHEIGAGGDAGGDERGLRASAVDADEIAEPGGRARLDLIRAAAIGTIAARRPAAR